MTAALAATDAWWPPGERLAYHSNTFGHLVGELVHRAGGRMPGERLRDVVAPLGAERVVRRPRGRAASLRRRRVAPPFPVPEVGPRTFDKLEGDALMNALAHLNPPGYSSVGLVNTPAWRSAQIGSTSGHTSASGIARIYATLLDPGRLLSPGLLAHATTTRAAGPCPILGEDFEVGLGFQPTTPRRPFGPNGRSFGHFGTGGAVGFADPDAWHGLRLRHEPRRPPVAELPQPGAHGRNPLPLR